MADSPSQEREASTAQAAVTLRAVTYLAEFDTLLSRASHQPRHHRSRERREPYTSKVRDREGGSNGNPSDLVFSEFIGGVGEGIYDAGKGTMAAVQATLMTNSATTIRNKGRGIAGMIDSALVAENTPARIQVSRAANAIANASARDIGHATGTVVGNVALSAAPGAALAKVAAVRQLRMAAPRPIFDPPQIGWVKETVRSDKPWKAYNDAAPSSRPGQAPTLMRTMSDGSKRPVKFDGIQGDYVIDRKWSMIDAPRARSDFTAVGGVGTASPD